MRLLFLGDIVGRSGREAVFEHVPLLRKDLALDFVIANCENAAGGFGVTEEICRNFFDTGIDVLTSGNHIWSQRDIMDYIDLEDRLLRPINFRGKVLVEVEVVVVVVDVDVEVVVDVVLKTIEHEC